MPYARGLITTVRTYTAMGRTMEPMTIITTRVPAYPLILLATSYTAPTQSEWASNNVRNNQIHSDSLVPAMAGPAASLQNESLVPAMAGPAISLQIMIRYPDRYPTFTSITPAPTLTIQSTGTCCPQYTGSAGTSDLTASSPPTTTYLP